MQSILAVDDSPSMRKMVSFTLTGAGYNVVEAVDGQDAFEKAQTHHIDLVLADQNMPRLDGIGLTRKRQWSLARDGHTIHRSDLLGRRRNMGCPAFRLHSIQDARGDK